MSDWTELPAVSRVLDILIDWMARPQFEERRERIVGEPMQGAISRRERFLEELDTALDTLEEELEDDDLDDLAAGTLELEDADDDALGEALSRFDFAAVVEEFARFAFLTAATYRPRGEESATDQYLRRRGYRMQQRGREVLKALAASRVDIVQVLEGVESREVLARSVLEEGEPFVIRGSFANLDKRELDVVLLRLVEFDGQTWACDGVLSFPASFVEAFPEWLTPLRGDDPPADDESVEAQAARGWRDAPVLDDRARPGLIAAFLADQWLRGMGMIDLLSAAAALDTDEPEGEDFDEGDNAGDRQS